MNEQEVKAKLMEDFKLWMRGQTAVRNEDGSIEYHDHDVYRYSWLVRRHLATPQD